MLHQTAVKKENWKNFCNLFRDNFREELYNFIYGPLHIIPAGIFLLKVNDENTRTMNKIGSKLTLKTPE